jgi:hypothetical protein
VTKKKTEGALSETDMAHVRSLHERFGAALSLEQVESNYRMSLGMPDANGRTPANREQLGAMKLLADLLIARPKAEDTERPIASIVVGCPYCGTCSCTKD